MQPTEISWADYTWNPTRGCSVVSPGCALCYAQTTAARFSGPGGAFDGFATRDPRPRWTGRVELLPHKLAEPLALDRKAAKRRQADEAIGGAVRERPRVFVNSMSDLFHEELKDEEIAAVFGVMAACPNLDFLVLTKRAARMAAWFDWVRDRASMAFGLRSDLLAILRGQAERRGVDFPVADLHANGADWPLPWVWLGVSAEDQQRLDERVPHLLACPAAVRWVSLEPLLGGIDLRQVATADGEALLFPLAGEFTCEGRNEPLPIKGGGISWIAAGGESGPGARPCDLAWLRSIREQCAAAQVPAWIKQVGSRCIDSTSNCAVERAGGWWPNGTRLHVGATMDAPRWAQTRHPRGEDPAEWPEDLRVRELPGGR